MAAAETSREIVNTSDQLRAAGGDVCAIVTAYLPSRGEHPYGWAVYRFINGQFVPTDPNAPWYAHGLMVFGWMAFRNNKKAAMEAAQACVIKLNGYAGPWTRNRDRDYVPSDINKRFPIPKREKR